MSIKKFITSIGLCGIAALALAAGLPTVALAQQEGLVNVNVEDNTVQIPVSVAAEVCDIAVNILSQQFVGTDKVACTIDQETAAEHNLPGYSETDGTGSKSQRGLVNLDVSGNTVQVPIGVAAEVCDVDANVIARQFKGSDETVCSIDQETAAEHNIGRFSEKQEKGGAKQSGLVNLDVSGNTVQVPIGIAAEVCDVDANVIAQQFKGTDRTVCSIDQETAAEHNIGRFSKDKSGARQEGLINVSVSGNTVQVPINVAAEVCDLDVNVLARQFKGTDRVACEIDQETAARHGIPN